MTKTKRTPKKINTKKETEKMTNTDFTKQNPLVNASASEWQEISVSYSIQIL